MSSLDFLPELAVQLAETGADRDDKFQKFFFDAFRLGPYGLGPIIDTLHRLFELIDIDGVQTFGDRACTELIELAEPCGLAVIELVSVFREVVPRHMWDPSGFCELRSELRTQKGYFQVCFIRTIFFVSELTILTR